MSLVVVMVVLGAETVAVVSGFSVQSEVVQSQELREFRHELVVDRKFMDTNALYEKTFSRVMQCVMECISVSRCTSVAWNRDTGLCQLSRYDISHYQLRHRKMTYEANWLAYTRIVYKVFNLRSSSSRYAFTFNEAKAACEALGFSIASPSDLREARDEGMNICVCGWLSDATNVMILQRPLPSCLPFTDGYELCNKPKADAWCKRH